MRERNGELERGGRRIGSGVLSGDYRFTGVDVVLIVLVMALLVGATWRLFLLTPGKKARNGERHRSFPCGGGPRRRGGKDRHRRFAVY